MSADALAAPGPLWAQLDEDQGQTLPLWKAVLIALAVELALPVLLFGVDWSFLPWIEPPPVPVMSVELRELPPEPAPPRDDTPPQPPAPPRQLELPRPVEVERPKPMPGEQPSKLELPKPAPKPAPVPKRVEKPTPQPEPEAPPLPSVFRDIKPVRKVKPVYPPEAEAQHIEGRVKVRLHVDPAGSVTDVEVLLAEPPGVFEESVLTAVRQYKFKPDGTQYRADQEIFFKLDD